MTTRINFVGPLPPPVHGFSMVNSAVLARLRAKGADVAVFDRTPRAKVGIGKGVDAAVAAARFGISVLRMRDERQALYAGLSGGLGQVVDAAYLAFARCAGMPIYLHHHSFAYLNEPSQVTRICFRIARDATHVVLCERMGSLLTAVYGVPTENVVVISNAPFIDTNALQSERPRNLTVGFLSNISDEKGIFEYFDVMDRLNARSADVRGLVAGPVAAQAEGPFRERLRRTGNVTHVGPVYNDDKDAFLGKLDVLLFPTKYANEAEPLTILEAFRAGATVISMDRGCISQMIAGEAGLVVKESNFVEVATAEIAALAADRALLDTRRAAARDRFEQLKSEYSPRLEQFVQRLMGGD